MTLLGLLILVLSGTLPGSPVEAAESSTVIVHVLSSAGVLKAVGAGVISGDSTVVTSAHVLGRGTNYRVQWKGRSFRASVLRFYRDRDLALLEVQDLAGPKLQVRPVADLRPGEPIFVVGARKTDSQPQAWKLVVSAGTVTALWPLQRSHAIQIAAEVEPGFSGGGAFDSAGRLVGVTSYYVGSRSNAFALPADWIDELQTSEPGGPVATGDQAAALFPPSEVLKTLRTIHIGNLPEQVAPLRGFLEIELRRAGFTVVRDSVRADGKLALCWIEDPPGAGAELRISMEDRFGHPLWTSSTPIRLSPNTAARDAERLASDLKKTVEAESPIP